MILLELCMLSLEMRSILIAIFVLHDTKKRVKRKCKLNATIYSCPNSCPPPHAPTGGSDAIDGY
jgi:predicted metal-binding protein